YRSLNQFDRTKVFAFFSQSWKVHVGWVLFLIQRKHVNVIHSPWMTLFYLVKQRSKIGALVTVRRLRVLRVNLRTEVLAIIFVLIRSPRSKNHGIRTSLILNLRMS